MHTQRTRRRIAQEQRLTHYDELEARSTMSRLQLALDEMTRLAQVETLAGGDGHRRFFLI